MPSRIAISGVGLVSALGQTASETFRRVVSGERGIAPLAGFDPGEVRSRQVGEVRGLRVSDVAPRAELGAWSRTDAMAVTAALEARAQAAVPKSARWGVVLGGTTGGMFETEELLSRPDLASLPLDRVEQVVSYPLSASLRRVADALGGAHRTRSICSACSGGAVALVQASAWLERGDVDYVLAGGADGLCRLTLLGFNALGATDPKPCRPFDRARAGLNLGEGAGALVLEREQTALARGARVLAWLDGHAVGAEAHHITHPEPTGARALELLREATKRAGLAPSDIDYVNAHGTGTQQNDAMEARALLELLGPAATTWISSCKAQLGHTLGAAGAVEAVLTVLALAHGQVPPAVGLVEPEEPRLRHARGCPEHVPLRAGLSSSFGFGGMSCVLAFSAPERSVERSAPTRRRIGIVAARELSRGASLELDPERSRRFDRGSALAADLAVALAPKASESRTGLVLGTAFGNVERTMAFLAKGRERGARYAPPAEFPHLVPSAPAGNASVYAQLSGPVFTVSELAHSGEAAFAAACELLEAGTASRIIAAAVAPHDAIVESVLAPALDPSSSGEEGRGEGAAGVTLAELDAGALCEVLGYWDEALAALPSVLPAPEAGCSTQVVLGSADVATRAALDASAWGSVSRVELCEEHGHHEALGALGLALAARLVHEQRLERVLVLSGSAGRCFATLLGPAS